MVIVPTAADRPRISIGVCGETGAGKTVFLTCLFQTLHDAFPAQYVVDFDARSRQSNALYFDDVERMLREKGRTEGTKAETLAPLTILLTPARPENNDGPPSLAVDLLDFAGGNVRMLPAVTAVANDEDTDGGVLEAVRVVQEFVENADALVVLVSAADLESLMPRGGFTASINHLIALCRRHRKPVALVLSQADRVSPERIEKWKASPSVERFKRDFSDDPEPSARGGRLFGIIEAVACYEEVGEGLEPKRQSADNSIWRQEAALVVARLARAAAPAAIERFESERLGDFEDVGQTARRFSRVSAAEIGIPQPKKVVIAVCGEPGAGKTVFLTCLFRTFKHLFGEDVSAAFTRTATDAGYFRTVEEEITVRGSTGGTTGGALHPLELAVTPLGTSGGPLGIELIDFAGGQFTAYSSGSATDEEDGPATPGDRAAAEVRAYIERADAFVVLISSLNVAPVAGAPLRDPFTPSVDFVIDYAVKARKPVALLFSQADRTPGIEYQLRRLPSVRSFEDRFAHSLGEGALGNKPFGLLRAISCYEGGADGVRPRRQRETGSIWSPDAAEVIVSLMRAVLPGIQKKFEEDAAHTQKEADETAERERAGHRRHWLTMAMAAAAGLAFIVPLAYLAVQVLGDRKDAQGVQILNQAAAALRSRPLNAVSAGDVSRVLRELNRGEPVVAMRDAADNLGLAIRETAEFLQANPRLDRSYVDDIERLSMAVGAIGDLVAPTYWAEVSKRLEQRQKFVVQWVMNPPGQDDRQRRWRYLRGEAERFASDQRFADILRGTGTEEKRAAVDNWLAGQSAGELLDEINRIQDLLQHAEMVKDDEFAEMVRLAGAADFIRAILTLRDNVSFLTSKIVGPLAPDLAGTPPGQLRFVALADRALDCSTVALECRARLATVIDAIGQAVREAGQVSGAIYNLWGGLIPSSPLQRQAFWSVVGNTMEEHYFFDSSANGRPLGFRPLWVQIKQKVEGRDLSLNDPTADLTARLYRPIYCEEMLYLVRGLAGRDNLSSLLASKDQETAFDACRPLGEPR